MLQQRQQRRCGNELCNNNYDQPQFGAARIIPRAKRRRRATKNQQPLSTKSHSALPESVPRTMT